MHRQRTASIGLPHTARARAAAALLTGLCAGLLGGCGRDAAPLDTRVPPPPRPTGVLAGLAGSDGMQILALHPRPHELLASGAQFEEFHGYPVLGRTTVPNMGERDQLLALVEAGIEASDGSAALCFEPRHAISVTVGERTVEHVICFECRQIQVHENGVRQPDVLTSDVHATDVSRVFALHGLVVQSDE